MAMKKGDIIRLEFNCYYAASGELFETTHEALAKEKELWHEGHTYSARVFIIGSGASDLPTGLELDLLRAKVDEKREVTLEAKDAYGAHNPLLVETVSIRELLRLGIDPEVGATVQRRNRTGFISGIFGGRVRIDYNHKLAGKALKYEYTVVGAAEKPEEKVRAVLDLHYGRSEEFNVEVSGKKVTVKVPDVCKFDQAWATQKLRVVLDLREHAGIDTIAFVEEYVKKVADDEVPGGEEAAGKAKEEKAEAKVKEEKAGAKARAKEEKAEELADEHADHEHAAPKTKSAKAANTPKQKARAASK
jgi:FKBP-type peptidyl-prolyl cis-trans isomerase 2